MRYRKCMLVFMYSTCYSCQILMKQFLDRFSKNTQISNLIRWFQWEPSCYTRTDGRTDGRTDRQTEKKKRIAAFINFAKAPKQGRNVKCRNADISKKINDVCQNVDSYRDMLIQGTEILQRECYLENLKLLRLLYIMQRIQAIHNTGDT